MEEWETEEIVDNGCNGNGVCLDEIRDPDDYCCEAVDEELPEWMYETCEHGLSAWLCSGPMHYSDEF